MHKDSVSFRPENNIYCVSSALLNLTSSTSLPHKSPSSIPISPHSSKGALRSAWTWTWMTQRGFRAVVKAETMEAGVQCLPPPPAAKEELPARP
jgi:hypothetical protein